MHATFRFLFERVYAVRRRIRWLVLLFLPSLIVLPEALSARILINEIMWAGSDLSASDEWIELARDFDGSCDAPLSLSGLVLTSVNTSGIEVPVMRFAPGSSIACNEYPVISRFDADRSRLSNPSQFLAPDMVLPNTKLLLRLRDALGAIIDEADDGIGDPMAGKNGTALEPIRVSMERVNLSLNGGLKDSWTTASESFGFDDGSPMRGTPGFANQRSNFSSSSRAKSVSMASVEYSESSSGNSESCNGELCVMMSGDEPRAIVLDFQNSSISSDQISYSLNSSEPYLETKNQYSEITNSSYFSSAISATSVTSSSPLRISEVLPNPVGQDAGEWIEIMNIGDGPADLTGWTLSVSGSSTVAAIRESLLRASGSGMINAGQYLPLKKIHSGLALPNKGGSIHLRRGNELMDVLSYPELPEGIAFGRNYRVILSVDEGSTQHAGTDAQPFCVPTEGSANDQRPPQVDIVLQSGRLAGEGSVTVNFEAVLEDSIRASTECYWDFQDGFTSGSCNPPSHTFDVPGTYNIRLQVQDYCINTLVQSKEVMVLEKPLGKSFSSNGSPLSSVSSRAETRDEEGVQANRQQVVISGVLPNPIGQDQGSEWVEIQNNGSSDAVLDGWKLSSTIMSRECSLGSILLRSKEKRKLSMKECPVGLSNDAGGVRLIDPSGNIRSIVEWQDAVEGKVYEPSKFDFKDGDQVLVHRVIDGDTIEVIPEGGVMVSLSNHNTAIIRLLGINAPEIVHPNKTAEPYGVESSNFLRALIEGEKIELQFDSKKEDSYGRLLAYVSVDGADIQKKLLQEGLARVYLGPSFSKKEEYIKYELKAREEGKGMWSNPTGVILSLSKDDTGIMVRQAHHDTSDLPIYLSEIYPSPQKGEDEWIKLFNPNDVPVSLSGWILDDIENGGSKPWVIPDGFIIGAGEYLVISSDQSGLKLNDDGDEVYLTSPDGRFSDRIEFERAKKGAVIAKNDQKRYSEKSSPYRAPIRISIPISVSSRLPFRSSGAEEGAETRGEEYESNFLGRRSGIGLGTRYKTPVASLSSGDLLMSRAPSPIIASLYSQILPSDSPAYPTNEASISTSAISSILAFLSLLSIFSIAKLIY